MSTTLTRPIANDSLLAVRRATEAIREVGYAIRVVSRMTGIPADTLRMWERRYEFPRPTRRPGGSRLYSEADVARLRLVVRALDSGFRPGDVVGQDSATVERMLRAATKGVPMSGAAEHVEVAGDVRLDDSHLDATLEAIAKNDSEAFEQRVRSASLTLGPRRFVTDFAQPLAHRIGEAWADGRIEVHQEHHASERIARELRILLHTVEGSGRDPIVVLTTPPGEPHGLGLALVAVYLASAGATPRILGTETPFAQMTKAAEAHKARVVGLTITEAAETRGLRSAIRRVAEQLPETCELWLGGGGAAAVLPKTPHVRLLSSWDAIDEALSSLRSRPATGRIRAARRS